MKNRAFAFLLFLISTIASFTAASQTTHFWTGGGASTNWSDTANWNTASVPVNGDSLVFPTGAASFTSNNDLTIGLTSIDIQQGGYTISGNGVFIASFIQWTGANNVLNFAAIDFGSGTVSIAASTAAQMLVNSPLFGNGVLNVTGPIQLTAASGFSGTVNMFNTTPRGDIYLTGATLPATIVSQALLSGSATLGAVTSSTANGIAPITVTGFGGILGTNDLTISDAAYFANIGGTSAGVDYGLLNVTGTVNLSNATLSLTVGNGFTPTFGQQFALILNDGADAVNGTFAGLAEGATFSAGGNIFTISYVGGDGNDVVVTSQNPLATTTTVASDNNPSTEGQTVTFTVTVSSATTPGGSVELFIGGVSFGTQALVSGSTTYSTSALTPGTYAVTANYFGDATHAVSNGSLAGGQTVNPAVVATTTTVASDLNPSFEGQTVTFTVTVSGGATPTGTVDLTIGGTFFGATTLNGAGQATFSTNVLAPGTHTVTSTYFGDAGHSPSAGSLPGGQVVNANAVQTITFTPDPPPDRVFGDAPFAVSATGGGSGNPVTFTSNSTGVCTTGGANGATITIVAAGSCSLTANQAGAVGFNAAAPVTRSFTVARAPQTITFGGFVDKVFGDAPFVASATGGGSGNPVTFTSTTTGVCTTTGTNGTTITLVGAGACSITLFQLGDANYTDVSTIQGFNVAKANQTITFGALPNRTIGDAPFTVSATGGGSGNVVTFASQTTAVCTTSGTNGSTVTMIATGTCTIRASQAGNANYNAGQQDGSFIVDVVDVDAFADGKSDFNADQRNDILFRHSGDGRVSMWLMNGSTLNSAAILFSAGTGWRPRLVGDFNGDGKGDIVWQHNDGRVALWLMNGTTMTSAHLLLAAGTGWTPIHTGDFNNDSRADIVWRHTDGRVSIWLMNGGTQIGGAGLLPAGTGWSPAFLADFNGDGKADILWQHNDGRTAIWIMNGAVQAGGGALFGAGTGWFARLVGDFNGDGRADILWEHNDGRTAMWLMNGATQVGTALLIGAGTGWHVTRVGDVNGDGKKDIVWQREDGSIALWTMNGTTLTAAVRLADPATGFSVVRMIDFGGDGRSDIILRRADGLVRMLTMNGTSFTSADLLPAGAMWMVEP